MTRQNQPPPTGLTDEQALLWLQRAQQHRAIHLMAEVASWALYSEEEVEAHPMWRVHGLGALARRLRLLLAATGTSGAALGRAAGLSSARIGQWTTGRSRPDPAQRHQLATALGIHASWLAKNLDHRTPAAWYAFDSGCPCRDVEPTFIQAPLDGHNTGIGALVERGLWCAGPDGCGQPCLVDGEIFYPAPILPDGHGPRFAAVTDLPVQDNCGPELALPWPHALWNTPAGPHRRGPQRLPVLLTRAPAP
ncbi:helix-turn-helix domain-containing protein [Kitasatospora sp. LaBMicrA B282]|uniref:helix-turn-helix domain-containing protein n=1 Tax=Kitasatospora sp. LaBMicrA B282 TaxID=3420949 RepID=UPI003D14F16E